MAGRIRSIKPEILEDEKTAALSHIEWRVFVSVWLIADDYGHFRGDPAYVRGQILWATNEHHDSVAAALETLARVSLLSRYTVRGQSYYEICGWSKHQKVDKPGKPRMPGPEQADAEYQSTLTGSSGELSRDSRETLATDLRPPTSDLDPDREREARAPHGVTVSPIPAAVPAEDLSGRQPRSSWQSRQRWWQAMLDADARIKAAGIEPGAPRLPPTCAGENEKNIAACARQLAESGFDETTVDEKMLHIVAIAEAEAMREGHRKWFKPALIWQPERANRAADTSLDEARMPRAGPANAAPREPDPIRKFVNLT